MSRKIEWTITRNGELVASGYSYDRHEAIRTAEDKVTELNPFRVLTFYGADSPKEGRMQIERARRNGFATWEDYKADMDAKAEAWRLECCIEYVGLI